ncbi:hypothetical protein SADUNF_Sadunf14G0025900 [Salix dunnii]|uniref:Uncharacterized protein n=1 Tax=Salix dunnii TaxID=1413687 RepID=A0A835JFE2_9ROSI|nr:hypothetical protein SADUNF_Sadunf14G0025900 [Salix dunnii]
MRCVWNPALKLQLRAELGVNCQEKERRLWRLREKKLLKKLSIAQDLADGLMASADIRDGRGQFSGPLLLSWKNGIAAGGGGGGGRMLIDSERRQLKMNQACIYGRVGGDFCVWMGK